MLKKIKKKLSENGIKKAKKVSEEEMFDFIQDRAFRLWDQAGRPQGRDWEFWFMAETEIKNRLRR
jgi:hypothetical protein